MTPAFRRRRRGRRRRCVRRDEPISDLGLPSGGLAGCAVFLEEDLASDLLPGAAEARVGVLEV